MKTAKKKIEKNKLLVRLERTQKDVGQMRSKLSSYICEPRTYTLFESIQNLKGRLDLLTTSNTEIIQALKERKKSVGDCMENIRQQFTEFHELQKGVDDYVQGMRNV